MEAPCLGNWVIKHAKSTKIGNTFGYEWVTTIIALSTHYQDIEALAEWIDRPFIDR